MVLFIILFKGRSSYAAKLLYQRKETLPSKLVRECICWRKFNTENPAVVYPQEFLYLLIVGRQYIKLSIRQAAYVTPRQIELAIGTGKILSRLCLSKRLINFIRLIIDT